MGVRGSADDLLRGELFSRWHAQLCGGIRFRLCADRHGGGCRCFCVADGRCAGAVQKSGSVFEAPPLSGIRKRKLNSFFRFPLRFGCKVIAGGPNTYRVFRPG
mgnify:CR=1 FL=1